MPNREQVVLANFGERMVYLVGLIAALFLLLSVVGMPSLSGGIILLVICILLWRVGVIARDE